MKKEKIISIILKGLAILILFIGLYGFLEYRLWKWDADSMGVYLPILVFGFSGTLFGIAALLDKNKK